MYNKTKKSNTLSSKMMNAKIIDILETVKSYYAREHNTIHVNAYERAIYQIKKYPSPITSGEQLKGIPGIGKGMIEKINTILETGTLPIIKEKHLDSESLILENYIGKNLNKNENKNLISNVLGFGEKLSNELKTKYGAIYC